MPSELKLWNSWLPRGTAALLLAVSLLCGGLPADEPLPDDNAPAAAKPKSESSTEEENSSTLDEKLAELLGLSEGKIESEIEQLERAISAMRDAGTRISDKDTGDETQKLQEQAVRDLERLIKLLNAREQNPSQSQNQNQNQNQQKDSSQDLKNHLQQRQKLQRDRLKPQNSGSGAKQNPKNQKGGPERSDADRARDTEGRLDPAKRREEEDARREKTVKDVWGHLPPHLREALQNNFSEKYLPKYEELVKRYYEALADKNRRPER